MRREPRRHAGFPPHARPRAGQPVAGQVRRGPRARTGHWLATGLVAVGGLAAGLRVSSAATCLPPRGRHRAGPHRDPGGPGAPHGGSPGPATLRR